MVGACIAEHRGWCDLVPRLIAGSGGWL
jgi:hypothetical protein